jgi:hypothetical protein
LCKVEHRRGDFMLPFGSYLGGELAEYKDPGHLVGKGWMQLDFDRLYVGNTAIPVDAKVVDVPGYKIDQQGRILGKGHAVRDTFLWLIPVLWPIDLLELPRRGPRPTLKVETALTLRVMEDIQIPNTPEPQRDPNGLIQRSSVAEEPQQLVEQAPLSAQAQPAPQMAYAPVQQMVYASAPPPPAYYYAPVAYMYMPVMAYAPVMYMQPYYAAPPQYYAPSPQYYAAPPAAYAAPPAAYGAPASPAVYAPRTGYYGGYSGAPRMMRASYRWR